MRIRYAAPSKYKLYAKDKRKISAERSERNASSTIEDKVSDMQLAQELQQYEQQNVTAVVPSGNMLMHLHAQTAMIENDFVLLAKGTPWLADYIRELTAFPHSKHDDQVDATSQALNWLDEPILGHGAVLYVEEQFEKEHSLRD